MSSFTSFIHRSLVYTSKIVDSPKEIELSLSTNTNNHTYVGGQQRFKMGSYYFKSFN